MERFRAMQQRLPQIGEVRGRGAMCAIELVADPATKEPLDAAGMGTRSRGAPRGGVIVLTAGTYGNVVRLLPPIKIDEALLATASTSSRTDRRRHLVAALGRLRASVDALSDRTPRTRGSVGTLGDRDRRHAAAGVARLPAAVVGLLASASGRSSRSSRCTCRSTALTGSAAAVGRRARLARRPGGTLLVGPFIDAQDRGCLLWTQIGPRGLGRARRRRGPGDPPLSLLHVATRDIAAASAIHGPPDRR